MQSDAEFVSDEEVVDVLPAVVAIAAMTVVLQQKQKRAKPRFWVRPIYRRRAQQGDYDNLLMEMRLQDTEMFFVYTRMNVSQFDILLSMVGPLITKFGPREPIPAGCRLAATLRYLADGCSFSSIAFAFRIGKSTFYKILIEVCDAIWTVLQPRVLATPNHNKWQEIADGFYERWNFPHAIGAVDGKHVAIQCPDNTGSEYFNYKKHYSICLFAVCDYDYKFTYVDIGAYGIQSDGGVLKESTFGKALNQNLLHIPEESPLPDTDIKAPYVFLGDEAFPLKCNLLRPFGGKDLCEEMRIFNYRLSRARRCIENAFGILVSRWRIFHKTMDLQPDNCDRVIKATVCLHNYLKCDEIRGAGTIYCPRGYGDNETSDGNIIPGKWRDIPVENGCLRSITSGFQRLGNRNAAYIAKVVRNTFMNYFISSEGSVSFQYDKVNRLM